MSKYAKYFLIFSVMNMICSFLVSCGDAENADKSSSSDSSEVLLGGEYTQVVGRVCEIIDSDRFVMEVTESNDDRYIAGDRVGFENRSPRSFSEHSEYSKKGNTHSNKA